MTLWDLAGLKIEPFLGAYRVVLDGNFVGPDSHADLGATAMIGLSVQPEKDSLGYVFDTAEEASAALLRLREILR
ncbi:MAG TPA: hypothetical protein VFB99_23905 [Vicinamibacterales bacterium]|nr:hypothetical protein [Vicinamibacterales bacterium]